jgi:hypothetical protein
VAVGGAEQRQVRGHPRASQEDLRPGAWPRHTVEGR